MNIARAIDAVKWIEKIKRKRYICTAYPVNIEQCQEGMYIIFIYMSFPIYQFQITGKLPVCLFSI